MKESKGLVHIAIDGPAASGKGTIAKMLAQKLGLPFFDTGTLYRGMAVFVDDNGIDYLDEQAVVSLLPKMNIEISVQEDKTYIFVNHVDLTERIRDNKASVVASKIASYKQVRTFLVAKMQDVAKGQSLVVEGRDIGSVVLPDAKYKFFLTASIEERALRRMDDLGEHGESISLGELKKQIAERDERDMARGGLVLVSDAIVIDSTGMNVKQTIAEFLKHIG